MGILQMADPGLRAALATALHETAAGGKEVVFDGGPQSVRITVRPLIQPAGMTIVTFEDVPSRRGRKTGGELPSGARRGELEQELRLTRETLRGTIQELETANEEMKSALEEYMSTNEELETSREELQSVNEELITVNTEYQKKNDLLTTINNDMRNLLNSTGIATVYLDEKLLIRRFTPAATELFKFIDSDVGRPVEDITSRLKADGLPKVARRVLDSLIPVEQEVKTEEGRWYSMRVHPYRTTDNAIEGVVASFADISRVKAAIVYAESIIDTMREPMLVLDEDLRVVSTSRAFRRVFGVSRKDTEGQLVYDLGSRQWGIPRLREMLSDVVEKNAVFDGYKVEHDFPDIGHRLMLLNARRIRETGTGSGPRILLSMEDVTGRAGLEPFSETVDSEAGDGR